MRDDLQLRNFLLDQGYEYISDELGEYYFHPRSGDVVAGAAASKALWREVRAMDDERRLERLRQVDPGLVEDIVAACGPCKKKRGLAAFAESLYGTT